MSTHLTMAKIDYFQKGAEKVSHFLYCIDGYQYRYMVCSAHLMLWSGSYPTSHATFEGSWPQPIPDCNNDSTSVTYNLYVSLNIVQGMRIQKPFVYSLVNDDCFWLYSYLTVSYLAPTLPSLVTLWLHSKQNYQLKTEHQKETIHDFVHVHVLQLCSVVNPAVLNSLHFFHVVSHELECDPFGYPLLEWYLV